MARGNAQPEDKETKAEREAAERKAIIQELIPKLAASCSFDMSKDQIFGRVIERLSGWGVNDDELGGYMKDIRVACEAHVAKRTEEVNLRAAAFAARGRKSIEEVLKA